MTRLYGQPDEYGEPVAGEKKVKTFLQAAKDVVEAKTDWDRLRAIAMLEVVLSRRVDLDADLSSLSRDELERRVGLLRALYEDTLADKLEAQIALDEMHLTLLRVMRERPDSEVE